MTATAGKQMYRWASELFPLHRSISGQGLYNTLCYLKKLLPQLKIIEISSGTKAFDWTVPDEWNIQEAYVADAQGTRLIDFKTCNLHVVAYSEPIDRTMSFAELDEHLHSLPEQPDAIPYVTSYYNRNWGFCLSDSQRKDLQKNPTAQYQVRIDSELKPGCIRLGELIIAGKSEREILLSTYICHPSMANNELSGPCVTAAIAQWIENDLVDRFYTYRILFLVETIGSIAYLSQNLDTMKRNTSAGFVLSCLGDDNTYSYVASRSANTLADRVARHVLKHHSPQYHAYSFLQRGSDERQYCSPGVDLPVCVLARTKFGRYPEYHTSQDDLSFISPAGLEGGYQVVKKCIKALEANKCYSCTTLCEPQLGKRGLYPKLSTKETQKQVYRMLDFLSYADGNHDLIEIADTIGASIEELIPIAQQLLKTGVVSLH